MYGWLFKHERRWRLFCYISPLVFWIILKILYHDSRSLNFCYHYFLQRLVRYFCGYEILLHLFCPPKRNIFVWIMFWHPEILDMILVEPPSYPLNDGAAQNLKRIDNGNYPEELMTFLARLKSGQAKHRNLVKTANLELMKNIQSHFPIHLGCTKMNWEWKQTGWWGGWRSYRKFTLLDHILRINYRRLEEPNSR